VFHGKDRRGSTARGGVKDATGRGEKTGGRSSTGYTGVSVSKVPTEKKKRWQGRLLGQARPKGP